MEARIISIQLYNNTLSLGLTGHPTDCMEKAHGISDLILGDDRWRFENIEFYPPSDDLLASNGIFKTTARRILPNSIHH